MHEDAPIAHQRELIAIRGSKIEIVEDSQNRQIALPGQAQREIEDGQLMREIQMGRGLVEEQDSRLLSQSSRQEQTLLLPARDLTNAPVDKVGSIDERQRTSNDRLVHRRGSTEYPLVRCAPGHHDIPAGERLGHQWLLRHHRHLPRDLGAAE
jgi:hypothetical protein